MIINRCLLLSSSEMFVNSTLLDNIHQSIIDLENNPPIEEIQRLLQNSMFYLDNILDEKTLDNLFILIIKCLSTLPKQSNEFYKEIFNRSFKNSNRLIFFSMIFSQYNEKPSFPGFYDRINDIMMQISDQIQNPKEIFKIWYTKINSNYVGNFIINILLISELNENIVSTFLSFIFNQKNLSNEKINTLIQKVKKNGFLKNIPESVLADKRVFSNFSEDDMIILIPNMTEQTFLKILPLINEKFTKENAFKPKFVELILGKFAEFNIDYKKNERLFNFFANLYQSSSISPSIFDYYIKNGINMSHQSILVDLLEQKLIESDDLNVFEAIINHAFEGFDYFSDKKFWLHLFSVVSTSEQKYSIQFLNKFAVIFEESVQQEKSYEIIESMIFDKFPTSNNGNYFLCDLINTFSYKYRETFNSNQEKLFRKVIENRKIPFPSFWYLFNLNLDSFVQESNNDPMILYACLFCSDQIKSIEKIKEINLEPLENEIDLNVILEFVKNNNFDNFVKMSEDDFRFVISALFIANRNNNASIHGLEIETSLPFYAILLKNATNKINAFTSNEIMLKSLNFSVKKQSPLIIESINSIVSINSNLINTIFFESDHLFRFYDILLNQLIENIYVGDKLKLLKLIFNVSQMSDTEKKNEYQKFNIEYFFDKNGINLFKFLISNMWKIEGFDSLQNIRFELKVFINMKKISSFFIKNINNSYYQCIVNSICLLEKYCKHVPNISKSLNFTKIEKIINENSKKIQAKEFLILDEFLKKNLHEISFDNIDSLLNDILTDEEPEKKDFYFELLFKYLMKDKTIQNDYFLILLERITEDHTIFFQDLGRGNSYKYLDNPLFINVVSRNFNIHKKRKLLVKKVHFDSITYPLSKIGLSIISKLLNNGSYQAFYCLKNIASSFPFLFTSEPQKMFPIILSKLDLYSSYLKINENTDKSTCNSMKLPFSVISFLVSLLHSVKFLDAFIPWVFQNLLSFNESQVLAMTYIFLHLYKIKTISWVVFAIAIKYNFPEIAGQLIEKDVNSTYTLRIIIVLHQHYRMLNMINRSNKAVLIDELTYSKRPFEYIFNNNSTIYPIEIIKTNFRTHNNELDDFENNIIEEKSFYAGFMSETPLIDRVKIFKFFEIVNKKESIKGDEFDVTSMDDMDDFGPYTSVIKYIRLLTKKPYWVYKWIMKETIFPCFSEHVDILNKVFDKFPDLSSDREDIVKFDSVEIDYFFLDQYCQNILFNQLIQQMTTNFPNPIGFVSPVIQELAFDKVGLICLFDLISIYIKDNIDNVELITKLIKYFASEVMIFRSGFGYIASELIDLALDVKYRTNTAFLYDISTILQTTKELPVKATHLIAFMIISDQSKFLRMALDLCLKIDEHKLTNLYKTMVKVVEKELNPSNHFMYNFICIFKIMPSFYKKYIDISIKVLNKAINQYNNRNTLDVLDFIFSLLNVLAPERKENQLIMPSDEVDFTASYSPSRINTQLMNQSILKQAPQTLIETNTKFWNLYNEHRVFLERIVSKCQDYFEILTFLKDFPELLSFEKRLAYFRKKMNNKINYSRKLKIRVNRSNILADSFRFLTDKDPEDWLNCLSVKFNDERGVDMGGLTKEWFTLIVREIFNPNLALFVLYENKCYQPNQFSGINQEHIEFFRFAGKIIARAIIQGQCVNAHFCRSFIRQILHNQVKLKDLEDIDENIYKSLNIILNEDVTPLALNFTININEYGSVKTILLKENGDEIDVTNENKVEYATLYANYHLRKSIINQITAFCNGFNSLISHDEIKIFSPNELDLLICGIPKIDVVDLEKNATFARPYHKDHPVIKMFFSAISKWDPDNLAKFLLFLTGSSQVPVNGFKDYADSGKPIVIAPGGDRDRLCVAHTCFNTLDLPEYENEDELNEKLLRSIQECEFGVL